MSPIHDALTDSFNTDAYRESEPTFKQRRKDALEIARHLVGVLVILGRHDATPDICLRIIRERTRQLAEIVPAVEEAFTAEQKKSESQ